MAFKKPEYKKKAPGRASAASSPMTEEKKKESKRFILSWEEFGRFSNHLIAGHNCSQRVFVGNDDKFYVLTRILDEEGRPFLINTLTDNVLIPSNVEDRIDEMELGMIGAFGHELTWAQVERLAINVMQGAIDCAYQIVKDYDKLGIHLPWPESHGESPHADPFEDEE